MKTKARDFTFAQKYVESGGNATEAALASCDLSTRGSAAVVGHRMLKKEHVREEIARICHEKGLTPEEIVGVIRDGIRATAPPKTGDPFERPLWKTRAAFVDMALKLLALYPHLPAGSDAPPKAQHLHIEAPARLRKWILVNKRMPTAEEVAALDSAGVKEGAIQDERE